MKLEINKELVLSTCHIKHYTSLALDSEIATGCNTTVPYGWRVCVDADINEQCTELLALVALAKANDCKWLVLDQDGAIVPELAVYDW